MPSPSRKSTVETCITLDVYAMLRTRMLVPGQATGGTVHWRSKASSMRYQALLREDGQGGLRLVFRHGDEPHDRECWVMLTTTPKPFSGRRWWFVCPQSGRLVPQVHMAPCGVSFASRVALGLDYDCQRESTRDRLIRKSHRLRDKLRLGADGWMSGYHPRPKWMRRATHERLSAELRRVDQAGLAMFAAKLRHGSVFGLPE